MNFITGQFVVFFIFVLCLGAFLKHKSAALYKYFLILASLLFYASAGLKFVPLLIFVAFLGWGTGRLMGTPGFSSRTRFVLVGADIALHVLLLAFFKYYEFLFGLVADVCGCMDWDASLFFSPELADLAFPVGLSFYTFQSLSYAIDHYRDPSLEPFSFTDVLCYVSFFPTVMSGPIQRDYEFFPQLALMEQNRQAFIEGMGMILSGLFKKVALATCLAEYLVDPVYQDPGSYSWHVVLLAVYGYSIQIFCDFSGYTDMAIGIARLMGMRLPQNFNSPYRAVNLQDFWRRWHISLSQWLRDYLYISMGGNRRGNHYVNIIATMIIGGLWHGSGLNFLIWGTLHGIGQAVGHAWKRLKTRYGIKPATRVGAMCRTAAAWFCTLQFVSFLWIFFRTDDAGTAWQIIARVASLESLADHAPLPAVAALVFGFAIQWIGPPLFRGFVRCQQRLPLAAQIACMAALFELILLMGPDGVFPFIYFSF